MFYKGKQNFNKIGYIMSSVLDTAKMYTRKTFASWTRLQIAFV